MSAQSDSYFDELVFSDVDVFSCRYLPRAIAWLEKQLQEMSFAAAAVSGLYEAHGELQMRLVHYRAVLAARCEPWFAMDQVEGAWWGFDPFDYDNWTEASEGMRDACGWVRIRGFAGAVWFGPDVHSVDDLEEEDLPPRLSEMVGAEVDRQLAAREGGAP